MPWGVQVPEDPDHVMYVWFDALVNYISTLGWPKNQKTFNKYWPVVQIAGKDNLRQQSAMWQAMLLSAGLKPSKQILINGFISVEGKKMSKSLGNVISPKQLVDRYGIDGARYLLIKLGPVGTDMDVSWKKFNQTYNSDLANGLGNVVSRVAKLCHQDGFTFTQKPISLRPRVATQLDDFGFDKALGEIWRQIAQIDKYIETRRPWELEEGKLKLVLTELVGHIRQIGFDLQPFLPETSEKITRHFKGPKITSIKPLFPRLK